MSQTTQPKRKVLVWYATRYGSTREIADAIAGELSLAGFAVDLAASERDIDPLDYDAVVLGSPLYMGKWLVEARDLVSRHRASLSERPVAVFTVGYSLRERMQEHLKSGEEALESVLQFITPVDAAFFPGKVNPDLMSAPDRSILLLGGVEPGDFRDFGRVRAWARSLIGKFNPV
ncbi:MAG: flavodoxin domain-containing protein [Methanolinea sp.]|nr:flavodoxin domain-containing protein [Methanolinea sp.]